MKILQLFFVPISILLLSFNYTIGQGPPVQEWVNRYDGPASASDLPRGIATDAIGNVYVAGSSTGNATALDYTVVKYDTYGNQIWVGRYDRAGYNDRLTGMAVDQAGNVYLTGGSQTGEKALTSDYTTVKFDANGNQVWVAFYDGPGNSIDFPQGGAHIGPDGNIYVTGNSRGLADRDMATVSYAPDGTQRWVARHDGPAHTFYDAGIDIAFDNSGGVYVAGTSDEMNNNDYVTIKYSASTGAEIWKSFHNGMGTQTNRRNQEDIAYSIAVDPSNNAVYVTGQSPESDEGLSLSGMDIVTIKYNAATGAEIWKNRYNGPDENGDLGRGIAVDDSGYPYVAGIVNYFNTPPRTPVNIVTIKYDPATGTPIWKKYYDGPASDEENLDFKNPIAIDANNNIYVAGVSTGNGSGFDIAVVKYDQNGTFQWERRYDGPVNGREQLASLTLDAGSIYVTGGSQGNVTDNDFVTIKYYLGEPTWKLWCEAQGSGVNCFADITDASGIDASSVSISITSPDGTDFGTFTNATSPGIILTPISTGYNTSFLFTPDLTGTWVYSWSAKDGNGHLYNKTATFFFGGPNKVLNLVDKGGHKFQAGKTLEDMLHMANLHGSGTLFLEEVDFSSGKRLKLNDLTLNGELILESVILNEEVKFSGNSTIAAGGSVKLSNATVNARVTFDNATVAGKVQFNGTTINGPVNFINGALVSATGKLIFGAETNGYTCDNCTIENTIILPGHM